MKKKITEAFEKIYGDESDSIFRFCLVRVSNREQALDITQETFLRLWRTLLKEEAIFNCRAFLFTVAHRLIIDWYRKKKSFSLEDMFSEDGKTSYDPPDEKTADNIGLGAEGRYILAKINELTPIHRSVVYLRFAEGLSPQEIGDILDISPNVASARINRGLKELRKKTGYEKKSDSPSAT